MAPTLAWRGWRGGGGDGSSAGVEAAAGGGAGSSGWRLPLWVLPGELGWWHRGAGRRRLGRDGPRSGGDGRGCARFFWAASAACCSRTRLRCGVPRPRVCCDSFSARRTPSPGQSGTAAEAGRVLPPAAGAARLLGRLGQHTSLPEGICLEAHVRAGVQPNAKRRCATGRPGTPCPCCHAPRRHTVRPRLASTCVASRHRDTSRPRSRLGVSPRGETPQSRVGKPGNRVSCERRLAMTCCPAMASPLGRADPLTVMRWEVLAQVDARTRSGTDGWNGGSGRGENGCRPNTARART